MMTGKTAAGIAACSSMTCRNSTLSVRTTVKISIIAGKTKWRSVTAASSNRKLPVHVASLRKSTMMAPLRIKPIGIAQDPILLIAVETADGIQ